MTDERFISVNEVMERTGLDRVAVTKRLREDHPDHIPVVVYQNLGTKPSYRIPAAAFQEWYDKRYKP